MNLKKVVLLMLCFSLIGFTGCSIRNNNKTESSKQKKIPQSLTIAQSDNTNKIKKPNYLVLSMNRVNTLNPIANSDKSVEDIYRLVYSGLIQLDDYLQPKPSLAKSWNYSDSGKTLVLNINENAKWSDGRDITSYDVVYTFDKILSFETHSPYKKLLSDVKYYTTDGSKTMVIELKNSDYSFINNLFFPILQKKFYQENAKSKFAIFPSSGKYIFESYNGQKMSRLKINNYYFGDKPKIKNINIYVMPDNSVKFDMFEERQLDAINTNTDFLASSESITSHDYKYATDELIMLGFNLNNKYLKNLQIRKAIAYCINRNEIVDNVLLSKGIISDSITIPGSWLNRNPKIKLPFSAEMAQSIFKKQKTISKAGLEILTTNDKFLKNTAEEVKNSLIKQGVGCYIQVVDAETYVNDINLKKYDICLIDYKLGFNNDINTILGHNNFLNYNSSETNKVLNEIKETSDSARLKKLYSKLDEIYVRDVPCITLFFRAQDLYMDNRIKGKIIPNMYNPYNEITSWSLKTN